MDAGPAELPTKELLKIRSETVAVRKEYAEMTRLNEKLWNDLPQGKLDRKLTHKQRKVLHFMQSIKFVNATEERRRKKREFIENMETMIEMMKKIPQLDGKKRTIRYTDTEKARIALLFRKQDLYHSKMVNLMLTRRIDDAIASAKERERLEDEERRLTHDILLSGDSAESYERTMGEITDGCEKSFVDFFVNQTYNTSIENTRIALNQNRLEKDENFKLGAPSLFSAEGFIVGFALLGTLLAILLYLLQGQMNATARAMFEDARDKTLKKAQESSDEEIDKMISEANFTSFSSNPVVWKNRCMVFLFLSIVSIFAATFVKSIIFDQTGMRPYMQNLAIISHGNEMLTKLYGSIDTELANLNSYFNSYTTSTSLEIFTVFKANELIFPIISKIAKEAFWNIIYRIRTEYSTMKTDYATNMTKANILLETVKIPDLYVDKLFDSSPCTDKEYEALLKDITNTTNEKLQLEKYAAENKINMILSQDVIQLCESLTTDDSISNNFEDNKMLLRKKLSECQKAGIPISESMNSLVAMFDQENLYASVKEDAEQKAKISNELKKSEKYLRGTTEKTYSGCPWTTSVTGYNPLDVDEETKSLQPHTTPEIARALCNGETALVQHCIETKHDATNLFYDVFATLSSKEGRQSIGYILSWAFTLYNSTRILPIWGGRVIKERMLPWLAKAYGLYDNRTFQIEEGRQALIDAVIKRLKEDYFRLSVDRGRIADKEKIIDTLMAMRLNGTLMSGEDGYILQKISKKNQQVDDADADAFDILNTQIKMSWEFWFTKGTIPLDYLATGYTLLITGLYFYELSLLMKLIFELLSFCFWTSSFNPLNWSIEKWWDNLLFGTTGYFVKLFAPTYIVTIISNVTYFFAFGLYSVLASGVVYAVKNAMVPDSSSYWERWLERNRNRTSRNSTMFNGALFLFDHFSLFRTGYSITILIFLALVYANKGVRLTYDWNKIQGIHDLSETTNIANNMTNFLGPMVVRDLPWYQGFFSGWFTYFI